MSWREATSHSLIGSKKEKEGGITHHLVSPISKVMGLTQSFQNLISINSNASGLFQFFPKLFGNNGPEGSECSQPCDLSKAGELERFWLSHRWLHDPMPITWPPQAAAGPAAVMSKCGPEGPEGPEVQRQPSTHGAVQLLGVQVSSVWESGTLKGPPRVVASSESHLWERDNFMLYEEYSLAKAFWSLKNTHIFLWRDFTWVNLFLENNQRCT